MSLLWALLPDEFMPLVIAGIGLAVILGFLRMRKAAALIGGICLLLISGPFFDALFDALPREEAHREFQRELATMRELCLKLLAEKSLIV